MTNEEDVEKKKGSVIFSLVSYVSINCIRFTGMISAQSTPTNNGVQSIYFVGEGQGDCNISTHSRPKAATRRAVHGATRGNVSTHSHPKVAAGVGRGASRHWISFNTQPPEGGCAFSMPQRIEKVRFQHTATRRWLHVDNAKSDLIVKVSTHSHPKVAAGFTQAAERAMLSFNTQPPEGGCVR